MKLLVARHGQSEADLKKVMEGRADFPLTAKGRRQAELLAGWITEHYRVDQIVTSPLIRAGQTAQLLREACGAPVSELPDLMEFNNGLLAGVPFSEVERRYPAVANIPPHESVYGQETRLAFRFRAEAVLSKILSDYESQDVVCLITHGGLINQLFRAFLKLPPDSGAWISTGDTGIHEWVVLGESRGITYLNSLDHLKGQGLTDL